MTEKSGIWVEIDESDEERIFRSNIRKFVEGTINPLEERAKKEYEETCQVIRREAAKRDILGLGLPIEVGGQGASILFQGICNEEIGRARVFGYGVGGPLQEMYTNFAKFGNRDLVKKWMPKFLAGEARLGIGSTEPRTGSDIATMVTTATKRGSVYILNGEKGPMSSVDRVDGWLLVARTGDSGSKGITQFFVEKDLAGIEKFHFDAMEPSSNLGGIRLRDVEVPEDHVVGELGQGLRIQMRSFEVERALHPFAGLGAAMESVETAVQYTNSRFVWGRPISSFEGIMFPLVESITKLDAVRTFGYRILRLLDQGKITTKESSMLRWYAVKTALESLDICIQVSGAAGYTNTFPHEKRYRWLRAGLFGHGTQEIQKLVSGREIFGREIYELALGRTSEEIKK